MKADPQHWALVASRREVLSRSSPKASAGLSPRSLASAFNVTRDGSSHFGFNFLQMVMIPCSCLLGATPRGRSGPWGVEPRPPPQPRVREGARHTVRQGRAQGPCTGRDSAGGTGVSAGLSASLRTACRHREHADEGSSSRPGPPDHAEVPAVFPVRFLEA